MSPRRSYRWLPSYLAQTFSRRRVSVDEDVHVLLCIADHYEPQHGHVTRERARRRVDQWADEYPKRFRGFSDSDGRSPRHSFFYPLEMYDAAEMDGIADLCRMGFGEVEVHLHHDGDNAKSLRRRLFEFKELLVRRHGMLSRHRTTGETKYGFVHGNWALDNSHPEGRHCGVNNELDVLRETGCYADFTMPSFPDATQTRQLNSIYYACDDPNQPRSHDRGIPVGSAPMAANALMLVQGPLVLRWGSRKWGVVPRVENGCLQGSQPPTMERLALWMKARVQVPTRKDWFFVKLHTHGAPESNQKVLLGGPMSDFHRSLAQHAEQNPGFHYHYVTAREMYNLARAAEAGWTGSVHDALDWELILTTSIGDRAAAASQAAHHDLRTVATVN